MQASTHQRRTPAASGLLYGLSAYVLWGLFPLFWPLLEPANPLEILACRIVFCFVVIAVLLAARHELAGMRRLDRGTVLRLCAAGIAVAINWGVYVWGVNNGHVIETSLGYFITPLVTIALGVVILHERLRAVQWKAVGLGVVAVVVLSVDYGRPPWIALALACSFGTYGFLKKGVRASPPEGLVIEGAVTSVPALIILAALALAGQATFVGHAAGGGHILLLIAARLVLPLWNRARDPRLRRRAPPPADSRPGSCLGAGCALAPRNRPPRASEGAALRGRRGNLARDPVSSQSSINLLVVY